MVAVDAVNSMAFTAITRPCGRCHITAVSTSTLSRSASPYPGRLDSGYVHASSLQRSRAAPHPSFTVSYFRSDNPRTCCCCRCPQFRNGENSTAQAVPIMANHASEILVHVATIIEVLVAINVKSVNLKRQLISSHLCCS